MESVHTEAPMRALRRAFQVALIGLGVLFALVVGVPLFAHVAVCERLPFGPCPNSPYHQIVGVMSEHRNGFIWFTIAYIVAVAACFRTDLLEELGREHKRLIRYVVLIPVLVTVGIVVLVLA